MTADDLKACTVKIGTGSGCLFQPMTPKYSYIFTANHLFEKEIVNEDTAKKTFEPLPDNSEICIQQYVKEHGGWRFKTIPFILNSGENYFSHPHADAAILKVPFVEPFGPIFVESDLTNCADYSLCGFPTSMVNNPMGEQYDSHRLEDVLDSGSYYHFARLPSIINYENIKGMSGGGYMKFVEGHLLLLGIQSKMVASSSPVDLGKTGFIPIRYFSEIVEQYQETGKLERLLPHYMSSFSFLQNEIFDIKISIYESEETRDRLSHILRAKAQKIAKSDITPIVLSDYLKEKLYAINSDKFESQQKGIWVMWLELFTILNIVKGKLHSYADFPEIFKRVKLIYSNTDEDFWIKHLKDLHKLDYGDLEEGGVVVVASNRPEHGSSGGFLDMSKITAHINVIRDEHDFISIDNPTQFPLDRYKFLNISTFKESAVKEVPVDFSNNNVADCLVVLRQLYEKFIQPNE
jgi:hypothetical protein